MPISPFIIGSIVNITIYFVNMIGFMILSMVVYASSIMIATSTSSSLTSATSTLSIIIFMIPSVPDSQSSLLIWTISFVFRSTNARYLLIYFVLLGNLILAVAYLRSLPQSQVLPFVEVVSLFCFTLIKRSYDFQGLLVRYGLVVLVLLVSQNRQKPKLFW